MKTARLILFAIVCALMPRAFAAVANEVILTQRNPANTGNVERRFTPVASSLWGFDGDVRPFNITLGSNLSLTDGVLSATGGGGAGNPGGSNGQIQYNANGSFGGFTASGDLTVNTGTGAFTFATVNSNTGSFGSATAAPTFTVNAKGLITAAGSTTITPAIGSVTGLGTGIATALAVNTGSAGAPVLFNGALGTPSSGVATNLTGTASGLTSGAATALANARTIGGSSFDGTGNVTSFPSPGAIGGSTPATGAFTSISGTTATLSSLTSGRVPFVSTGGLLVDNAALAWNGSALTINLNATAPTAPITGTMLHMAQADSVGASFLLDSYGINSTFGGRRSGGTAASKSAITTNQNMVTMAGYGYGATAYSTTAPAIIGLRANQTFTDSAWGTYIVGLVTPNNSTTIGEVFRADGTGFIVTGLISATGTITPVVSATPTTSAAGNIAFDSNAWASSRGALQVYDGTANTYVVAALASDTPSDGQVPVWNTGGTITWEAASGTAVTATSAFGTDNRLLRSDGSGRGAQASGITIDDSDNVSGVTQLTATTLNVTEWVGVAKFDAQPSTDDTAIGRSLYNRLAGATIAQWEAVYMASDGTWKLADANGSGTYPARGLAKAAYSSTDPAEIVTSGVVRNDAWNWTPGGDIYLSATAGGLTQTAPSTSGDKVQKVGWAISADVAQFDFDGGDYLTVQ